MRSEHNQEIIDCPRFPALLALMMGMMTVRRFGRPIDAIGKSDDDDEVLHACGRLTKYLRQFFYAFGLGSFCPRQRSRDMLI